MVQRLPSYCATQACRRPSLMSDTVCRQDHLLSEFSQWRGRLECYLAFGASWWETIAPLLASSVRTGMLPTINTMNVIGLVSIPGNTRRTSGRVARVLTGSPAGMMTGQLLAGQEPATASRYQIVIMFM